MIKKINNRRLTFFLWGLFVAFFLLLVFTTHSHYGIAWDENRFVSTGKYHLIDVFSALGVETNLSDDSDKYYYYIQEEHTASHGVVFDMITVLLTLVLQDVRYESFHLIRGLLALPTFLIVGLITSFFTNKRVGFFAMVLLLLTPRFWGNLFVSPIDIPTALFFSIAVISFIYYVKSDRSLKKAFLLGIPLGLVIVQRLVLGYVAILDILILFIYDLANKKFQVKKNLQEVVVISISSFFFMHLFHPYLLSHPLTGIMTMVTLNAKFAVFNADVLFDGQSIHASQLPWYYLPKYILITTPLLTLTLFVAGVATSVWLIAKKGLKHVKSVLYLYLILLFCVPFFINTAVKPILYDSWRMFLFLCVPMTIVASIGLHQMMLIGSQLVRILIITGVVISLFFTTKGLVALHPYEYVYFNSLVGGLTGAEGKYETDYWGLGYKEAIEWFNENIYEEGENYVLMTEGDPFSSNYYFKPGVTQTVDFTQADYYISSTRWNKHLLFLDRTVHTINREGVALIYIQKIPH